MKDKIQDAIHFFKAVTLKKIANGLKLLGSYYLSRLIGKPIHHGLPISIAIEPTTHCNLRCPQCPSGLRSFSRPTGKIDPSTFRKVVDQLKNSLCYLTFYFQGEPYLHPQFLDMVAYAESQDVYTATSTNAHYLDEKNAEATVRSGLSRLIVSVDGLEQGSYEKYRVGGSLEKVVTGIKNLVKAKNELQSSKPYIIVQFLVMKHNENEARSVKKFAADMGVNETRLKTVQVYDYENGSDLIPQKSALGRYNKGKNGRFELNNRLYNHCWKMWHSSVITWDGRVVPCCFDKDADHVFGNVLEEHFNEIWVNGKYQDFRKMLFNSRKSIDICRNCTEGTNVWI